MPGSGKDTLSQAIKERGYKVIVMSEVLKERYAKEALPGERLMDFAFRMRRERGRGFVAELTLEKLDPRDKVVVINGVRNWEEVEVFRRVGEIVLIAIHSSPKTRYERLIKRGRTEDKKYEDLAKRDFEELQMGIGNVIAMADYVLTNEGDVEGFIRQGIELVEKVSRDP
ncbi:MAG: AAA family ATPase [Sulfolobales archaeon]|nr:AAA family ATPase [Sulfolobales archaeon]MCG2883989.1 AAA family ATPase [Sulfolobales archaeon]MCG2908601.1 AAA family ATPase [Sulfolobales archaeon]